MAQAESVRILQLFGLQLGVQEFAYRLLCDTEALPSKLVARSIAGPPPRRYNSIQYYQVTFTFDLTFQEANHESLAHPRSPSLRRWISMLLPILMRPEMTARRPSGVWLQSTGPSVSQGTGASPLVSTLM